MRRKRTSAFINWTRSLVVYSTALLMIGAALAAHNAPPAPSAESPQPEVANTQQPMLSEAETNLLIEEIKEVSAMAEKALDELSSDRLHREAVLKATDYDPERLFEWVKRETRWTPYRGRLRGVEGVLMDRRGNSLDRSLLLAELLEDAGYETRLARTTLHQEAALDLVMQAEGGGRRATTDKVAGPAGLQDETAEIQREVASLATKLATIAGLDSEPNASEWPALAEAARDHWWVQARVEADWRDFDPEITDPVASGRPEPDAYFESGSLPEELEHRLELRIVIERWQSGTVEEEVPLEVGFSASELAVGGHVQIDFLPFSEDWRDEAGTEKQDEELWIADSARFWLPAVTLKESRVKGEWFSAAGLLTDSPTRWVGQKKMETAVQALDGLGASKQREPPPSYLTAVWLEYEVQRPGATPTVVRRELSDILGAHRRSRGATGRFEVTPHDVRSRGLALLGRTMVLPLTAAPAPATVERAILKLWAENRNPFIAIAYLAAGEENEQVHKALEQLSYQPIDLLAVGALRDLWSRNAAHTFLDRINILSTHYFLQEDAPGVASRFGIDLVSNAVGVLSRKDTDPRLIRLEQGVLDTLAESVLFEPEASMNPYHLFATETKTATRWHHIEAPTILEEQLPDLPPNSQARVAALTESGQRIVVSPTVLELGGEPYASWWEIDPRDGTTLGRGFRGWGAEVPEKLILEIKVDPVVAQAARSYGRKGLCHAYAMSAEAVAMRLADKMMFAGGPGPKHPAPSGRFAKACYTLK